VPRDTDQIAQIEQLEQLVGLGTDVVQLHVDLQPLSRSENVGEACFSVKANRENPACHANRRFGCLEGRRVRIAVLLEQLGWGRRRVKSVRIRLVPARFDLGKLFLSLEKLIDWVKR
jgi:hypothetical protein